MDAEVILTALLWISVLLAVLLILMSAATVGRKLADLEYLTGAGLNGTRTIQAWVNARTHANRVFLGIVFLVISILLLADAPLAVRTWANRVMFVLLLGSYTISSAIDWVDERRQLQILQARNQGSHERSFAAGVKQAEDDAVAVPESGVEVRHLQGPAVDQIVTAATPAVVEAVKESLP